jgi:hypothetical protein
MIPFGPFIPRLQEDKAAIVRFVLNLLNDGPKMPAKELGR